MQKIKATVFHSANRIGVEEVPRPAAGVGEAVLSNPICSRHRHILHRSRIEWLGEFEF